LQVLNLIDSPSSGSKQTKQCFVAYSSLSQMNSMSLIILFSVGGK
jgi:hypothetical protein